MNGFSLLSLLVSMTLGTMVLVSATQALSYSNKGVADVRKQVDFQALEQSVRTILSHEASCSATVQGAPINAATEVAIKLNNTSNTFLEAGRVRESQRIESILLQVPDAGTAPTVLAQLRLESSLVSHKNDGPTKSFDIFLLVTTNGEIATGCATLPSGGPDSSASVAKVETLEGASGEAIIQGPESQFDCITGECQIDQQIESLEYTAHGNQLIIRTEANISARGENRTSLAQLQIVAKSTGSTILPKTTYIAVVGNNDLNSSRIWASGRTFVLDVVPGETYAIEISLRNKDRSGFASTARGTLMKSKFIFEDSLK